MGIRVNGKLALGRHQLVHQDVVTFGDGTSLIFEDLGDATRTLPMALLPSMTLNEVINVTARPINSVNLLGKNLTFELPLGRSIIGRGSSVRVHISSRQVSRNHAAITVTPNHVTIEDLNSANGTCINGVKLARRQPLNQGDRVSFGTIELSISIRRLGEN
jgi:pSer/pThr/pTyr-binding forkhead associated (FHA) protein